MEKKKVTKKKKTSSRQSSKITKKELENKFLLLTFLLAGFAVLITTLNNYSFTIMSYNINYSVFIIPILILVSNYITKKLGFDYSLKSILMVSLIVVAFTILLYDLLLRQVNLYELCANTLSVLISLFINLAVYYYIITNIDINKEKFYIYLNYIFTTIIFHIIYMLFMNNLTIGDEFWKLYFISIFFEILLSVVTLYFDLKIKRGIEKKISK